MQHEVLVGGIQLDPHLGAVLDALRGEQAVGDVVVALDGPVHRPHLVLHEEVVDAPARVGRGGPREIGVERLHPGRGRGHVERRRAPGAGEGGEAGERGEEGGHGLRV